MPVDNEEVIIGQRGVASTLAQEEPIKELMIERGKHTLFVQGKQILWLRIIVDWQDLYPFENQHGIIGLPSRILITQVLRYWISPYYHGRYSVLGIFPSSALITYKTQYTGICFI